MENQFIAGGLSFDEIKPKLKEIGIPTAKFIADLKAMGYNIEQVGESMDELKPKLDLDKSLTGMTQAFMSFNTIINTGKGIIEAFGDESKTAGEKVGALTQGAMTLIPAI